MSGFLRVSKIERETYTLLRIYKPRGEFRLVDELSYWPEVNGSKGLVICGNSSIEEIVNLVVFYAERCQWIALDKGTKGYKCVYTNVTKYEPYDTVLK